MLRQYLIISVTAIVLVSTVAVTLKTEPAVSSNKEYSNAAESKLQQTFQPVGYKQTIRRLKDDLQRMEISVRQLEESLSAQAKLLERISLELNTRITAVEPAAPFPSRQLGIEASFDTEINQLTEHENMNSQQPFVNETMLATQELEKDKQRFLDLDQALMTQQIDNAWSQTIQQQLQNLEHRFTTLQLNGTSIASSDCRTNLCKVEWVHANDDEQQLAMNLLALRGASEVSLQFINGPGNQRPRTVAFLKR